MLAVTAFFGQAERRHAVQLGHRPLCRRQLPVIRRHRRRRSTAQRLANDEREHHEDDDHQRRLDRERGDLWGRSGNAELRFQRHLPAGK